MAALKMARKPKQNPSFFKVLIGDFVNKLRIPPAFVKNFQGNVPTNFTLKSNSGSSWRVTVQNTEGSYFFCGGWSNFVEDQGLDSGDFVVFYLVGKSSFDCVIYGPTGCGKKIVLKTKRKRGRPKKSNEVTPSEAGASSFQKATRVSPGCRITRAPARRVINVGQQIVVVSEAISKHPSFTVVLKKYQKFSVVVPSSFAREAGLAEKRSTVIKDPKGRMWPLGISVGSRQVRLSAGWTKFRLENRLVAGDTLLFQYIRGTGNAIHVQIVGKAGYGNSGR
ncbi:B3 DNA binding domain - like 5 [Theobroma cacao]|uniref:TF-B3 domain-containing protein n=1 Tax=Theobroma cacao TaxID=3641 RepID=A0A061DG19_THECC|nr:Uncharacterized protein TCM_000520 [Theobroma cacao]WRX08110.1 B3 DNA binding domain - like 5 [Theobroma cacao]